MIRIGLNTDILGERLKRLPPAVRDALVEKEGQLGDRFVSKAGARAPRKSGKLASNIRRRTTSSQKRVVTKVRVYGKARAYAGIQEYGGKTAAHEIAARKAGALAFMVGGKQMIVASVHHPGATIPAHSYLGATMREMREQIRVDLIETARAAAGRR